ncbi:4-alpha-glucanotransferase [Chitinivibrio alkaliphilus ACht1]|uniref:4-alpha-glucanotransferase n=1 Tax=Chitinivibrio alkaliphilus ACht1 TaxID=1313304 RepID=U7DCI0_9BACT|nr:4-alpha-glucanotransferase [Chitinivibrio alkaliphilus ACht1]
MKRMSGVFLHITSLPSPFGIGDLGPHAYRWIDLLAEHKQSLWQMCPVNPVGYGYSPYMSLSAFAGNTMLISPELLCQWGYLGKEDVEHPNFSNTHVEFSAVDSYKQDLLHRAFLNFTPTPEYQDFCTEEAYWLEDYVLFLSLSRYFKTNDWNTWPKPYSLRDKHALEKWQEEHHAELEEYRILQFIFQSQWFDLKTYANSKGVHLFGDAPYYVAYASSDVWAHRELFELDETGSPLRVGGVPPDYFSEDGQLWGNPLYNWDALQKSNYAWWIKRIKRLHFYTDYVRIDHFRAFEAYWAVPADSTTAKVGEWVPCPGEDFFRVLRETLGELPLIAEDLGTITQDVIDLRMRFDIPGMKVLQFAFDGNRDNWYLPYNCGQNSVMYSGTHDNDTLVGWITSLDQETRSSLMDYLDCCEEEIPRKIIRETLASVSTMALLPLQDILRMGSEYRFNTPGTVGENWDFRFTWDMLHLPYFAELAQFTDIFGRA